MSSFLGSTRLRHLLRLRKELSLVRTYRNRSVRPSLKDFNERQEKIDTSKRLLNESEHYRRALFTDWNYDVELFALGARLRETFSPELLKEALRDPSFNLVPQKEKIDISLRDSETSNERLALSGQAIVNDSLQGYLCGAFPRVPPEGIAAFLEHLTSSRVLASVALHIGILDILVSEDYPPSRESLAKAFCAVIGAHAESGNNSVQTQQLVVDLLGVQLIGADLHDIWKIPNPLELLGKLLRDEGSTTAPEPRLQWVSGKNTILASYHIGIYSNTSLIGESTGESVEIATEVAATDALRRIFDTDMSKRNWDFQPSVSSLLRES